MSGVSRQRLPGDLQAAGGMQARLKKLRLGFLGAFGLFGLAFIAVQLAFYLWGGLLGWPGVYSAAGGLTTGAWLVALIVPGVVAWRALAGQDRRNFDLLTRLWDSWRWFDHGVDLIDTEEEFGSEQERSFARASSLDPDDPYARNNLAAVLIGQGRLDEAIRQCREAIRSRPDYYRPYANLGMAWARKGRTKTAISLYRKALQLNPRDSATQLNLGLALAKVGRRRQAAMHLREFVRLDPRNPRRAEVEKFLGKL